VNSRIVITFILVAVLPVSAGLYYASRISHVPLILLLAGYVAFIALAVAILVPLNAMRERQRQRVNRWCRWPEPSASLADGQEIEQFRTKSDS
jgi:hypothetical protein